MSNADKLFYELGFEISIENDEIIKYKENGNEDLDIVFMKKYRAIYGCPYYDYFCDMPLLKAINMKCKELGWLGDEDV